MRRTGRPSLLTSSVTKTMRWSTCIGRAMEDEGIEPVLVERLLESFYGVADWMRNREG